MDCQHYWIVNEMEVCQYCGLVKDPHIFAEFAPPSPIGGEKYYHNAVDNNLITKYLIVDAAFYFNLPLSCIDIIAEKVKKDMRPDLSEKIKIALHLYETTNAMGNYLPVSAIAHFCQVNPKCILQNAIGKCYFEGEDVLNKLGRSLLMTSDEIKMVHTKMEEQKNESGHSPLTKASAYIYYYMKPKLSLNEIAKVAGVSPVSISRYVNSQIEKKKKEALKRPAKKTILKKKSKKMKTNIEEQC